MLATTTPTWEIAVEAVALAHEVLARAGVAASCDGAPNALLVKANGEMIPSLNAALVQAGVKVFRLSERRRRLEDAYFELVTRSSPMRETVTEPPNHPATGH